MSITKQHFYENFSDKEETSKSPTGDQNYKLVKEILEKVEIVRNKQKSYRPNDDVNRKDNTREMFLERTFFATDNVVSIFGKRGAGKTSILMLACRELINKSKDSNGWDMNLVLPITMPERFSPNDSCAAWILQNIAYFLKNTGGKNIEIKTFEENLKNRHPDSNWKYFKNMTLLDIVEMLINHEAALSHDLTTGLARQFTEPQDFGEAKRSVSENNGYFMQNWQMLVDALLYWWRNRGNPLYKKEMKEAQDKTLLIIPIDDADVQINLIPSILSDIFLMSSPNVVFLFTACRETLEDAMNVKKMEELDKADKIEERIKEEVKGQTNSLLNKILPQYLSVKIPSLTLKQRLCFTPLHTQKDTGSNNYPAFNELLEKFELVGHPHKLRLIDFFDFSKSSEVVERHRPKSGKEWEEFMEHGIDLPLLPCWINETAPLSAKAAALNKPINTKELQAELQAELEESFYLCKKNWGDNKKGHNNCEQLSPSNYTVILPKYPRLMRSLYMEIHRYYQEYNEIKKNSNPEKKGIDDCNHKLMVICGEVIRALIKYAMKADKITSGDKDRISFEPEANGFYTITVDLTDLYFDVNMTNDHNLRTLHRKVKHTEDTSYTQLNIPSFIQRFESIQAFNTDSKSFNDWNKTEEDFFTFGKEPFVDKKPNPEPDPCQDKKDQKPLPSELTHAILFAMDMTGYYYPFKFANNFAFYEHRESKPPKFIKTKYNDNHLAMNLARPIPRWPKMIDVFLAAEGWNNIYAVAVKAYQYIYDETANFFKDQNIQLGIRYSAFNTLNEMIILCHIRNIFCIHYHRCLPQLPEFFSPEKLKGFIHNVVKSKHSTTPVEDEWEKELKDIRNHFISTIKYVGKRLVQFYRKNQNNAPLHDREQRFLEWVTNNMPYFIILNFVRIGTAAKLFETWSEIIKIEEGDNRAVLISQINCILKLIDSLTLEDGDKSDFTMMIPESDVHLNDTMDAVIERCNSIIANNIGKNDIYSKYLKWLPDYIKNFTSPEKSDGYTSFSAGKAENSDAASLKTTLCISLLFMLLQLDKPPVAAAKEQ